MFTYRIQDKSLRRTITWMPILVAFIFFVIPHVAYAGTNNGAIQDIMLGDRYKGMQEALAGVTGILDYWFSFIISIIAWFIMSSAMLKNCIAGAYAANPNLWDKVHDSKVSLMETIDAKSRGTKVAGLGTFTVWVLSWFPDFKELSDFREDNIRPKDYFLKAIPQMIGAIMISVVLYNGYYRDLMVKVAGLGCELIERFLYSVDPIELLDRVTNSFGNPDMASAEDDSNKGQIQNGISKEIYSQTISFWTDIRSEDAKSKLAQSVESWVATQLNSVPNYLDAKKWETSYKVSRVMGEPDLSTIERAEDGNSEYVIKAFKLQCSGLSIDSSKHNKNDYWYRVILTFKKVREGVTSTGTITDIKMTVPLANLSYDEAAGNTVITNMPTDGYLSINQMGKIDGKSFAWDKTKGILTVKDDKISSSSTINCSGLQYTIDGKSHVIASITFSSSANKISMTSASTNQTVDYGQALKTEYKDSEKASTEDATAKKTGDTKKTVSNSTGN